MSDGEGSFSEVHECAQLKVILYKYFNVKFGLMEVLEKRSKVSSNSRIHEPLNIHKSHGNLFIRCCNTL